MLATEFERAQGYGEIFSLVKKAVRRSLGVHRVGLMLYLGNLPIGVGAFHPLGTNDIVINRRLLNAASASEPKRKGYVFSILLHEYLHSLGYTDERQVRAMTYRICVEHFGFEHPVVDAAVVGPWAGLREGDYDGMMEGLDLELVRDFERIDIGYII